MQMSFPHGMLNATLATIFRSKKGRLLILLFVILTFTSCVEYKIISIQTLKPAEIGISKDFSKAVAVASIYRGIEGVEESLAQAAIDSTAAVEAILTLAESLADSPMMNGIAIPTRVYVRDDASKYILPFTWETVEGLVIEDDADMLISLEYMKVKPSVDSHSFWDGYAKMYYGAISTSIYGYWRVYDVTNRSVVANYLYRDTLTWDQTDYVKVNVGEQIPGFFTAAKYSGYVTGIEFAKQIAPSWMDEQRVYYHRGSGDMKKAAISVQNNEWLDAAQFWQKIIQNPKSNPALSAKAAFNMALANEMNGKFDVALDWLDKSLEYYPLSGQSWYKRILELRVKVMEKF